MTNRRILGRVGPCEGESGASGAVVIALGANLPSRHGGPRETLETALRLLEAPDLRIAARARWIATPAFPAGSGPDYVNGAAILETGLEAEALLGRLMAVEAELGRTREGRWGPRCVDLDLLCHGQCVAPNLEAWRAVAAHERPPEDQPALVLPHPRLQRRAFALAPAMEVAPGWVHPVLGLGFAGMFAALPEAERREIRVLE